MLQLPKLELCFADGTSLWLRQASTDILQRTIDHQGELLAVDLREISPLLEADVHQAAACDRAGVIFFTLRQRFKSSEAFVAFVQALHARQPAGAAA